MGFEAFYSLLVVSSD